MSSVQELAFYFACAGVAKCMPHGTAPACIHTHAHTPARMLVRQAHLAAVERQHKCSLSTHTHTCCGLDVAHDLGNALQHQCVHLCKHSLHGLHACKIRQMGKTSSMATCPRVGVHACMRVRRCVHAFAQKRGSSPQAVTKESATAAQACTLQESRAL